jgi:hypothetical protein
LNSVEPKAERLGVSQGEANVLAQESGVRGRQGGAGEEPGEAREILIGQETGGVFREKTGGEEYVEALLAVKVQNGAEAVEHLAADTAVARFEAAEGAVVDLGALGDLLLGETTLVAEPDEEATQIARTAGGGAGIGCNHRRQESGM